MKILTAVLALIFLAGGLISGTSAQSAKSTIRIVPSNIIDALQKKVEAEPKITPGEDVKLPKGEEVAKHPTDPKNAYLSFMRFRFPGKSLVIRYSEPCT